MALQEGNFSWLSLMTKDTDKANKFYAELFDWKLTEMEFPDKTKSTIYSSANMQFGNPVALESGSDHPSHWVSYVTVNSVDESCKRAEKMGGKVVVPAFDIPTVGRTAVVCDPEGAPMHFYKPDGNPNNTSIYGKEVGQLCWMEMMVDDPKKSQIPYYTEIFGWKVGEPMEMNGGAYYGFEANGEGIGGFMKRPPEVPKMPAMWMPYFAVDSVDNYTEKAEKLGAKIHMEKTDIPETGFFSLIEDPTGAMFYTFEFIAK